MKQSDKDIVESILRGEEHGYSILLQRYRVRVYSLAFRIVRQREEAEEAAQDAFVRAFRSLDHFEHRSRFSTWLYRITYNTALTYAKRRGRQPTEAEQDDGDVATDEIPADLRLERKELRDLAEAVIDNMRPEYATVLTLFYLQEQGYEEIAEITGTPLGTIKNRLHRARGQLRRAVLNKYSYVVEQDSQ
ncbi:MAG: sigma-70 family RNA polymerase sigma factor [Bacteroidota bacterium]|nr:sigma-70 family RNA polymerase sigma factor [Bacteroidota bacterium]